MKSIETLVEDIQNVFQLPHEFAPERAERFGQRLATLVKTKIEEDSSGWQPRLRMSNLGTKCDRKLWYSIHEAANRWPIEVSARIKFLYGDILEQLLLFLAEEAGHTVAGCQDLVEIDGVRGRRDAIIDGVLVDVKSAATQSFKKFEQGLTYAEDDFGYLDQLFAYLEACQDDPRLVDKNRAAFLVIGKELGHIVLDVHNRPDISYRTMVSVKRGVTNQASPPPRRYEDEPEGASGNRKLSTVCSYCDWRHVCWPELRAFAYSNKPSYLTRVVREPKVPEFSLPNVTKSKGAA